MSRPRVEPLVRFLPRFVVDTVSGCWHWQGPLQQGYGQFTMPGENTGSAHVAAYRLFVGPVPAGLELDHLCHTDDETCPGGPTCPHRSCVNPDHLEPVTTRTNVLRGRGHAAVNAKKQLCHAGHPLIDRECQECERVSSRARYHQRKAEQGIPSRSYRPRKRAA